MRGREGRRKGGFGSGFGALDEESLPLFLEELIPPRRHVPIRNMGVKGARMVILVTW